MNGFALLVTCTTLISLLAGCTNPIRPSRDEWPQIGTEFTQALRWDIKAAATFIAEDKQEEFQTAFPADGLLRIIEARHEPLGGAKDGLAQGRLTLEYYRVPSVTIKKQVLPVTWSCTGGTSVKPCSWRVTTPPVRLP